MIGDPMQPPAREYSASDHCSRYEALRLYAVERHAPTRRDGLVVLWRQGVAAWMDACSSRPPLPPRPPQAEHQRPSPLPDDASAEVVRVLAAMTLSHIQQVHA